MSTREQWLADRRTAVTGTDAGAILGVSKFAQPLSVYLDKIGEPLEQPDLQRLEAGKRFERAALSWYADRETAASAARGDRDIVSIEFADPYSFVRSRAYPNVGATFDGFRMDSRGSSPIPVDAKIIRWKTEEYGDEYTDEIPLYYLVQLVVQMAVVGAPYADLAVVFSGQELSVYRVHRDEVLIADVMSRCQEWYERHVLTRTPPTVDGTESYRRYLQERIAQRSDGVIEALPDHHTLALERAAVTAEIATLEDRLSWIENNLKAAIGDAWALQGPGWRATWKQAKDTVDADWEQVALVAATSAFVPIVQAEVGWDMADLPTKADRIEAEAQKRAEAFVAGLGKTHTRVVRRGGRRFVLTFNKPKT